MAKISVLIPSYNHARYLGQTLDSVVSQTERDLEILVLDDGSNDDSFSIAQRKANSDARIRCYQQDNRGTISVLNKLFSMSSGDFICHLGSDDIWEPTFLAESLADLQLHPQTVATFSSFSIIDETGILISPQGFSVTSDLVGQSLARQLLVQNCLGALTACIRRTALDRAQPFARNFTGVEDWDLWLRLALVGDLRLRVESKARYRLHGENQSSKNIMRSYQNQLLVLREHGDAMMRRYILSKEDEARVWDRKAWLYGQIGEREKMAACMRIRRRLVGPSVDECISLANYFSKLGDTQQMDQMLKILRGKKRQREDALAGLDT